jgi:hypothetical protein
MIGKVLPSIMGRKGGQGTGLGMGMNMAKEAMSGLAGDMQNVGEPIDIASADSGGEFSDHPAKM